MRSNIPLRSLAQVSLSQIQNNFKFLVSKALPHYKHWQGAVAMVKANAYGHGLVEVSRALERERSMLALGVASIAEGIQLRKAGLKCPVWVFSDCSPWTESLRQVCEQYYLSPVLVSKEDVVLFLADLKRGRCRDLSFQLKWNTGMNRLGIPMSALTFVRDYLIQAQRQGYLKNKFGLCTHFAKGGEWNSALTRTQGERFLEIVGNFSSVDTSYIHCAGTAMVLGEQHLKLGRVCNAIRPGIGLYGYTGVGTTIDGLKPALKWKARVALSRTLKRGDEVGYGATYKVKKSELPQTLLCVGYGDGFMRHLSNQKILIGGVKSKLHPTEILGRVSMDLTAVGIKSKLGSWVTLLGENGKQGEFLASAAGTIVYELLTGISSRVPRVYE